MVILILVIIGLAFGSFVNALVWRIHEIDSMKTTKLSKKQQKYRSELSIVHGRSMCSHCHHTLGVMDLIPVISWVYLRGRCRYCRERIDDSPLVELSTAALFVISYIYWPVGFHGGGLFEFICWLLFLIGFMACAVYDLRWYLLPNKMVYPMLMLAFVQVLALTTLFHGRTGTLENALWGLLIGGGIFYLLFQASRGKWIGGGDVKLGALLGLIVGGPLKAFLLLFGASVAGTVVSIPLIVSGRMKRNSVLPFGPFLLFAAVVIRIFGASFISWSQRRGLLP